MRNYCYLFILKGWKQVMELSKKYIFVANTSKMLIGLMTSEKGAIEKDRNKSTSSIYSNTFIKVVSNVPRETTAS